MRTWWYRANRETLASTGVTLAGWILLGALGGVAAGLVVVIVVTS